MPKTPTNVLLAGLLCACATPDGRLCEDVESICDDGADDDCDGLVDCEDGDCDTPCVESCTNGTDDDNDGLTDCRDDDCWGLDLGCHADGVQVEILGGRLTQRMELDAWGNTCASVTRHTDHVAYLSDVHGEVRVLEPGARWSTAAAMATCAWSFRSGFFVRNARYSGFQSRSSLPPVERNEFSLDPGCALVGTSFLPMHLFPQEGKAYLALGDGSTWSAGPLWYSGVPARRNSTFSFSRTDSWDVLLTPRTHQVRP